MRSAVAFALLLSGCAPSYVGRYEAIGGQGRNVLLLDTVTGQLEVQAIPDIPDTLPEHKPVI